MHAGRHEHILNGSLSAVYRAKITRFVATDYRHLSDQLSNLLSAYSESLYVFASKSRSADIFGGDLSILTES